MKNRRPARAGPSDPRRPAAAACGPGRAPAEWGERTGTAQPGGQRPAGEASRIPGNGGGPAADQSPLVWLLGNDHPAADRSIDWRGGIPSLIDPDTLIVDMTTLTEDAIYQIDRRMLGHIQKSIRDKFFGGGSTIVVIMSAMVWAPPPDAATRGPIFSFDGSLDPYAYSNYHVLPTVPEIVQAGGGRRILSDTGHDFKAYLDAVSHFNFYIEGHDPTIRMGYGGPRYYLERVDGQDIRDNSGHYLGFTLVVTEAVDEMRTRRVGNTGKLVFLPPYTEPAADAIGKILSACRKALLPCRPASGPAAGPASAPEIQPGGHAPQREMAPGLTVAENGPTADPLPLLPAGGAGRGGAAGHGTAPPGGGGGLPAAGNGHARDAFLSYHHEAKDGVARPLAEGLEKRGVTVWWDSTAMKISDTLSDKIREGLNGARCGVVIVSRGYLDSGWGQTELGAMFLKNFPIFPVLHGVTAEEAQKKLPALSGKLMRPWDDRAEPLMDEIAREIKKRCGHEDGGARRSSAAPYPAVRGAASEIRAQVSDLRGRRDEILGHRRLLYAKGAELEEAVVDAFRALGFAEAKQMAGADQADCIIDINAGGYLHGLVEVKGADGRTGERHIAQCAKWVDKAHEADGKPSKGIFVSNQHRSAEYPGSTKDRLWFEEKELEYAKMRDICIIPSCVLFEAVKRALDEEAPVRAEMAARIAGTGGVLERVF